MPAVPRPRIRAVVSRLCQGVQLRPQSRPTEHEVFTDGHRIQSSRTEPRPVQQHVQRPARIQSYPAARIQRIGDKHRSEQGRTHRVRRSVGQTRVGQIVQENGKPVGLGRKRRDGTRQCGQVFCTGHGTQQCQGDRRGPMLLPGVIGRQPAFGHGAQQIRRTRPVEPVLGKPHLTGHVSDQGVALSQVNNALPEGCTPMPRPVTSASMADRSSGRSSTTGPAQRSTPQCCSTPTAARAGPSGQSAPAGNAHHAAAPQDHSDPAHGRHHRSRRSRNRRSAPPRKHRPPTPRRWARPTPQTPPEPPRSPDVSCRHRPALHHDHPGQRPFLRQCRPERQQLRLTPHHRCSHPRHRPGKDLHVLGARRQPVGRSRTHPSSSSATHRRPSESNSVASSARVRISRATP